MSKTIELQQPEEEIVMPKFALHNWSYKDYNDYIRASISGNLEASGHLLEKIIEDWSMFDVPEGAEHPFDELNLTSEALPLVFAVRQAIADFSETLDTSLVHVDMGQWKWGDFNRFKKYSAEGSEKAITMMRQVCVLQDDWDAELEMTDKKRAVTEANRLKRELNAVEGILMMTALTQTVQRVFSGKN